MSIEFVGRGFHPDEKLRQFATEKLGKATKFLEDPIEVRVTLTEEKHRHTADLHVAHRHGVLQAAEEHDNVYDAVNLAVDKVEKQARRSRKKFQDNRRRSGRVTALPVGAPETVPES